MGMIALRCPSCEGDIELDDAREYGFCLHCGTKILIQDAVKRYQISGKVELDTAKAEANCVNLAQQAYKNENYEEAYQYYTKSLEYNSENYIAVFRKGVCAGYLSELNEIRKAEVLDGYTAAIALMEKQIGSGEVQADSASEAIAQPVAGVTDGKTITFRDGMGEAAEPVPEEDDESEEDIQNEQLLKVKASKGGKKKVHAEDGQEQFASDLVEETEPESELLHCKKQITDELEAYLIANVNAVESFDMDEVFPSLQEAEFAVRVVDEVSELLFLIAENIGSDLEDYKRSIYREAAKVCNKLYPHTRVIKYVKDITVDPKTGDRKENKEYFEVQKPVWAELEKRRKEISGIYRNLPSVCLESERLDAAIANVTALLDEYKVTEKEFWSKNPQAKDDFGRIYWLSAVTLVVLGGIATLIAFFFFKASWPVSAFVIIASVLILWLLYTTVRRLTFRKRAFTPELWQQYKEMKLNKQALQEAKKNKKDFMSRLL